MPLRYPPRVRFTALSAVVAGLLLLGPAVQARGDGALTLDVAFFSNGAISVTLPDGTPVGSTNGAPTVIPAGFYQVVMSGPGGCIQLPLFDLSGPGASVVGDMSGGETTAEVHNAYFLPNTTYTWRTDTANTNVIHTFMTSGTVAGAAPGTSGGQGQGATTPTSEDIVGSAILPFRGTLTGAVSASGRLTFAFRGKSVTTLAPGRYRLAVSDRSTTSGFFLQRLKRTVTVTGAVFTGKRSPTISLTAGTWAFTPVRGAKPVYSIVVA